MARDRRFSGLKDLIHHLNAVGSRGLAAIGSKSRARLLEDEKTVTLQVGKSVFDGAPRNMRTELWMSSLQRKGIGVAAAQKYEDMLLSPIGAEAAADIDKDLSRTFPSTRRFAAAKGQDALRCVLRAYAAYDPEVGYCQGMNFVAGLLLMYLPERHAFGGLVVLMQDRGLRKYYSTDMSLLQTHLWQLGRLMPPRLCSHLESIGVLPLLYGASWLMTCFSADFPASFSARVMDVIMADKMDQALLKASVALLKACESQLLGMSDMEDALQLLKMELPAWEEPLLHDVLTDAFAKPWSSRQLQLLGSLEGAETVAEALARVQKANLAASIDSNASIDSTADEGLGSSSSNNSSATTPHTLGSGPRSTSSAAAAGAGAGAGAGAAGSGSSGGAAAAAGPPLLFPPPPSPRRPSSTGGLSGVVSPSGSRGVSRTHSQSAGGLGPTEVPASPPAAAAAAAAAGSPRTTDTTASGAAGTAAAAGAAAGGLGSPQSPTGSRRHVLVPQPALHQQHHHHHNHHQQQQHHSHHYHHHHQQQQQQHQHQQQQHLGPQHDMIDMSSPRASFTAAAIEAAATHAALGQSQEAAAGGALEAVQQQQQQQQLPLQDHWDPFGLADVSTSQQQQQPVFSSVAASQQPQQPQQQLQQQKPAGAAAAPSAAIAAAAAANTDAGQELLRQQLIDLSFTQLSLPGMTQQQQQRTHPPQQQQQQQQERVHSGSHHKSDRQHHQQQQHPPLAEADWGEFLSPR